MDGPGEKRKSAHEECSLSKTNREVQERFYAGVLPQNLDRIIEVRLSQPCK